MSEEATTVAIWGATGSGLCWLIFIVSMWIGREEIDLASCMLLSIFFVMLTVANQYYTSRKVCAKLATVFASIYCILVCIVYYTQLTFVRLAESPSPEALSIVQVVPTRSVFFALDQLGYFFMSLSIVCIAWTLPPSKFRWWLGFLGVWGTFCIAVPLMPSQYDSSKDDENTNFGIILLSVYGALFVPTYLELANRYRRHEMRVVFAKEALTPLLAPKLRRTKGDPPFQDLYVQPRFSLFTVVTIAGQETT